MHGTEWHCRARQGIARKGRASRAKHSTAGQCSAWQCRVMPASNWHVFVETPRTDKRGVVVIGFRISKRKGVE